MWIFLSPHLDDAAFSCGGLIWEQVQQGAPVEIWTICAGDPPPGPVSPFAAALHTRWQSGAEPSAGRRQEDIASSAALGAAYRHFPLPDCIYRRSPDEKIHLYASEESLFDRLHPLEAPRTAALAAEIASSLPSDAQVVAPLGLGNHVDHQLTRRAAELLGRPLLYYADFPYAQQAGSALEALSAQGWQPRVYPISQAGMQAWSGSIAAHASQMSTFWASQEAMQAALQAYARSMGSEEAAVRLWQPPSGS